MEAVRIVVNSLKGSGEVERTALEWFLKQINEISASAGTRESTPAVPYTPCPVPPPTSPVPPPIPPPIPPPPPSPGPSKEIVGKRKRLGTEIHAGSESVLFPADLRIFQYNPYAVPKKRAKVSSRASPQASSRASSRAPSTTTYHRKKRNTTVRKDKGKGKARANDYVCNFLSREASTDGRNKQTNATEEDTSETSTPKNTIDATLRKDTGKARTNDYVRNFYQGRRLLTGKINRRVLLRKRAQISPKHQLPQSVVVDLPPLVLSKRIPILCMIPLLVFSCQRFIILRTFRLWKTTTTPWNMILCDLCPYKHYPGILLHPPTLSCKPRIRS